MLGDALAATIKDEKAHILGDRDLLNEYDEARRRIFKTVTNERSIAAKKTCQMDPDNIPQEFWDNVEAGKKNPEMVRNMLMSSMDLQTILDLPAELKGKEWGPNGKPVIGNS
jgi:hypothetical protein